MRLSDHHNSNDGINFQNSHPLLKRVLLAHQNWNRSYKNNGLLMATWFLAGRVSRQMWANVKQDGKCELYRFVIYHYSPDGSTSAAFQNDFGYHLPDKKLRRLRQIIYQLPEDNISKNEITTSLKKVFILTVYANGKNETHFYDRKQLPAGIAQIVKILGITISL